MSLEGVAPAAQAWLVAVLHRLHPDRVVVAITDTLKAQEQLHADAATWLDGERPQFFPAWETLPQESRLPHADIISERLETLIALRVPGSAPRVGKLVVTSVTAVQQRTFTPADLDARTRTVRRGETVNPLDLIEWLEAQGYEPEAQVSEAPPPPVAALDAHWGPDALVVLCGPQALALQADHHARQVREGDPFHEPWEALQLRVQASGATWIRIEDSAPEGRGDSVELSLESLDAFRPIGATLPAAQVAEEQRRTFFQQMQRWLRQGYHLQVFCTNAGDLQRFGANCCRPAQPGPSKILKDRLFPKFSPAPCRADSSVNRPDAW